MNFLMCATKIFICRLRPLAAPVTCGRIPNHTWIDVEPISFWSSPFPACACVCPLFGATHHVLC